MRKSLRRNEHRSQYLIFHIESALLEWLHAVHITLDPDEVDQGPPAWNADANAELQQPGKALWDDSPVLEVSRSRKRLVWQIVDDVFARYVVHCCCRFHSIVSYSKDTNGRRLTFLLRPNRGGEGGVASLATPPATDYDSTSSIGDQLDTISLGGSEPDMEERSQRSHLEPVSEDETEEVGTEADLKMLDELPESASSRVPMQYRMTRSLLTDMKKRTGAYVVREQSLWNYVFS